MTKPEEVRGASEIVKKAFGRRPDFPSGKEYVDEVRGHISKQEEIREVIDGVATGEIKPTKALRLLSDLGVVRRGKCPNCAWSQLGDEAVGMTPCFHCNSTGYITEPLIKQALRSSEKLGVWSGMQPT